MPKLRITETSTLAHICYVAAERFAEHAKAFRASQTALESETGLIQTAEGARRMAEQFEKQVREAKGLAMMFAEAEPFEIITGIEHETA